MSDHVTSGREDQTRYGLLRSFVTLTDTGKPLDPTDEPEHDLHGMCWCSPLVETDVATGDHLFIHRRSLDAPHIERAQRPEETDVERVQWGTH
jgi:hypothetical protein